MNTIRIFISSVQREFAQERKALRDILRNDPLIRRCRDAGLPEPEFDDSSGFKTTIWRASETEIIVQPELITGDLKSKVLKLLANLPMSRSELSKKLGQKKPTGHLSNVIRDLLDDQIIEYTLPDTPRSRAQQYRLTEKGRTKLLNLKS